MLPDRCAKCQSQENLVLEGESLEPICLQCLGQLDPARSELLGKIFAQRGGTPPTPPPLSSSDPNQPLFISDES